MAINSLRDIVDGSFVRKFQGLATGTTAITKGASSKVTIQTGLRVGAQTFARGVQGLNGIISYLNVGKSTLEGLISITDKMKDITKHATQISTSSDGRDNLNEQFYKLARDYEKVVSDAKFGDRDVLTTEGISGIFQVLGLDKEASESIAAVFDKFVVPPKDDNLASEAAKGTRPYNPPASAYVTSSGRRLARSSEDYENIFDHTIDLKTRPDAFRMLHDLDGLQKQLKDNVKAMDGALDVVGQNISLVRAAGFAFLDLSKQASDSRDADQIAEDLRDRIRKDAKGALSQAENLQAIVVAALAFDASQLTKNT